MDAMRKERRGFASMSPEKQREIASKGGRAAHEKGTAHEWTPDEARNAGRKGGSALAVHGHPPRGGNVHATTWRARRQRRARNRYKADATPAEKRACLSA